MTEIEKIAYAKSYIEQLANGINPLTNQPVPDADSVNNIHISRCLFYVSDILRQVIENGGVAKKKTRTLKQPFHLSFENRLKFQFSDTPIPITEITKRINDLIDSDKMSKLSYKYIIQWLIELEALSVQTDASGKSVRRPTRMGQDLGISVEQRYGQNGIYSVTVYHLSAQRIILDNLDAIIELSQRPKSQNADSASQIQPYAGVQILKRPC